MLRRSFRCTLVVTVLFVLAATPALAQDKGAVDVTQLKQVMAAHGFTIGTPKPTKNGFSVPITRFEPKLGGLTLKGSPDKLIFDVQVQAGKLLFDRAAMAKAGFSIDTKALPKSCEVTKDYLIMSISD